TRHRQVFHAARHDDHLACGQVHLAVAKSHRHLAVDDEEHLVLLVVLVPDELTLQARELDRGLVYAPGEVRRPRRTDLLERRGDVGLRWGHGQLLTVDIGNYRTTVTDAAGGSAFDRTTMFRT